MRPYHARNQLRPALNGRRNTVLAALLTLWAVPGVVNAQAGDVKTLTKVDFAGTDDALEFSLHAAPALVEADLSARTDGTVLMLRVENTKAGRVWLDTPDDLVKRTLLHPSRRKAPAAVVRVRLKKPLSDAMLRNIMVRSEAGALVVQVPRTEAIAAAWAAGDGPTAVAEAPAAAEPAVDDGAEVAEADEADEALVADADEAAPAEAAPSDAPSAPAVEAVEGVAVAEEAQPIDPEATALPSPHDAAEAAPLSAAMAGAPDDGPGFGPVLMALLMMVGAGIFMWRKLRSTQPRPGQGPLIKPVGSHLLGPKQSLLLVDVAGEMVLLGTSDKGVQMLTKIDRSKDAAADAHPTVEPAVVPTAQAIPADAMPTKAAGAELPTTPPSTPVGAFAEKLGRAVARIRAATTRPVEEDADDISSSDAERDFFAREQEAVREAAEMDALDALADAVEDEPVVRAARRAPRRTPPPVRRPAAPVSDGGADLLARIRQLQGA